MHHVFVSYSRSDSDWVTGLISRLEATGHTVWIDQRDIPLTLPWFEDISDAITAADLFLVCDSKASRTSANCAAESDLARDEGKQRLVIAVGSDQASATATVDREVAKLDPAKHLRTELAVLARDWEKGGRKRNALVSRRTRRRLEAATVDQPPSRNEREFLRESRRRARRRTAISALVGLMIVGGTLIAVIANATVKVSNKDNDIQAQAYARTVNALSDLGDDPYRGLQVAGEMGATESAIDASVLEEALATKVPDDAFTVPAGAGHFSEPQVAREVAVVGPGGGVWERAAGAREQRAAHRVGAAPQLPAPPRAGALSLRREPHSGTVEVWRGGMLWRRITFSYDHALLRLSPDERELAAGRGSFVEVAALGLGSVRTTLSGAAGAIRDLAWSRDGSRLWALSKGFVTSWKVRDGRVLLDQEDERFEALLPAANPASAWVVAADGLVQKFDLGRGKVTARLRIADRLSSGAGAADGSVAALSGERGVWLVPLEGGQPQLLRLSGCEAGRPTFMDPQTVFVPCVNGNILEVSVAGRQVERRIFLAPPGVFAVRALPKHGVLLASDTAGQLFAVRSDSKVRLIASSECGGSITRIVASADERTIAPVGSGTGLAGCLGRAVLTGGDPADSSEWQLNPVLDDAGSPLAEAAAVSSDGDLFAYGYSDGTVVVHPTRNILPTQKISTVDGEIRDMYVSPDDQMLVATRTGIVQRIPLCVPCLSNRSMARLARTRIERGLVIGTAVNREDGATRRGGA